MKGEDSFCFNPVVAKPDPVLPTGPTGRSSRHSSVAPHWRALLRSIEAVFWMSLLVSSGDRGESRFRAPWRPPKASPKRRCRLRGTAGARSHHTGHLVVFGSRRSRYRARSAILPDRSTSAAAETPHGASLHWGGSGGSIGTFAPHRNVYRYAAICRASGSLTPRLGIAVPRSMLCGSSIQRSMLSGVLGSWPPR